MKADAGGRELFSGFQFGMDDWGIWRGVRWHDIAFLDATCRVGPKRGRVRALQSRIPPGNLARRNRMKADGARGARTRLGDDGNLMPADGNFFSGVHFGMDDWGERARPACGFGRRARTIWLAIQFGREVFGATPKTATGTVALPSKVPTVRPKAVCDGRMRQ